MEYTTSIVEEKEEEEEEGGVDIYLCKVTFRGFFSAHVVL